MQFVGLSISVNVALRARLQWSSIHQVTSCANSDLHLRWLRFLFHILCCRLFCSTFSVIAFFISHFPSLFSIIYAPPSEGRVCGGASRSAGRSMDTRADSPFPVSDFIEYDAYLDLRLFVCSDVDER